MPVQSAPITLQEAERVWKSQARPSARSVARALTQAGRPVHFTTVARWKRDGLLTIARSGDPRASSQPARARSSWRCPDNAVPVGLGKGAAGCMVAHQDLADPRGHDFLHAVFSLDRK